MIPTEQMSQLSGVFISTVFITILIFLGGYFLGLVFGAKDK